MIFRKIESQQMLRHGKSVWYVHVQKDLLTPSTPKFGYFGDNRKAADDYAKQLTDSRQCVGGARHVGQSQVSRQIR